MLFSVVKWLLEGARVANEIQRPPGGRGPGGVRPLDFILFIPFNADCF